VLTAKAGAARPRASLHVALCCRLYPAQAVKRSVAGLEVAAPLAVRVRSGGSL